MPLRSSTGLGRRLALGVSVKVKVKVRVKVSVRVRDYMSLRAVAHS